MNRKKRKKEILLDTGIYLFQNIPLKEFLSVNVGLQAKM
jgi:hypothetical protein